jgi:LysR family glycine cleavage system transcriptional activator
MRISSSVAHANFRSDGVDAAIRNVPDHHPEDPSLIYDKLIDVGLSPVCSPGLLEKFGPLDSPGVLAHVPLIHDDQLVSRPDFPGWAEWLAAADLSGGDIGRGLRFSSADHALDAAREGAGILLTHTILAYDDVLSGRLVMPFGTALPSRRAYYFVCPKSGKNRRNVLALRSWLQQEIERLDDKLVRSMGGTR